MDTLRIGVFNGDNDAYSQTFVRDHITRLPGKVTPVTGGGYRWAHQGRHLFPGALRGANFLAEHLPAMVGDQARKQMDAMLASFLKRRQFDVVLAEFADIGLSLVDACRRAGVPLVVHCHGYDVYVRDLVEPRLADYTRMFEQAAATVVVSTAMAGRVQLLGAPAERIHVIPCGVDVTQFRPGAAEKNPPTFLYVGRFVEKKAPHLTILAFERVRQLRPETHLLMAGDGPLLGACRQLVRGLRVEDAVTFLGRQDHDAISTLMAGARCLVQHSVRADNGDSEGSPVAVVEAGAAGLPVVATRHAGILDTVADGETGLLVDEHDVSGMAESMLRLVDDPDLAGRLGRAARERVGRLFSMDVSIGRLHNVLAAVVGDKAVPGITDGKRASAGS